MGEMEDFGALADGSRIGRVRICAHGLTAHVMTWGASVQDLRLEPHPHPLVLGFDSFDPYLAFPMSFGAVVGRVANRISGARARIAGMEHQFDRNFRDRHCLHGGRAGSGTSLWQVAERGGDHVALTLTMADGDMGFPGELSVRVVYRILEGPALATEITATTSAPTLCSFAPHSYFNLDGTPDASAQLLTIHADRYLPVDDDLIPTGERREVAGTAFDFRTARAVGTSGTGYDHNFCLSDTRQALRPVATLTGALSGVTMSIETTEPGLQFYDGSGLHTGDVPGLSGQPYGPRAGLALEPQTWPDAPNQSWPHDIAIEPGATYRHASVFRFGRDGSNRE